MVYPPGAIVKVATPRRGAGERAVGKRRPRNKRTQRPASNLTALAVAYGLAALLIVGGLFVIAFGEPGILAGDEATKGAVARLGVGLVALGLLAAALTAYLHWAKTRP